jgi:hypothetical protein
MIEEDSTRFKNILGLREIGKQDISADMLEHTDADDLIKGLWLDDITIIANFHSATIFHPAARMRSWASEA